MNLARYPPGISNFGRFLASFFARKRAFDFLLEAADLRHFFFDVAAATAGATVALIIVILKKYHEVKNKKKKGKKGKT
jgi:hypothetical protein